ncbi:MAG: hypothetical protein KKH73_05225 [Actinobacteria bacterium]|nr:hypothetical protein [Actinomycetota bacterium]
MMSNIAGRRPRRNIMAVKEAGEPGLPIFWWWPIIIAPFSVLGLLVLYWHEASLFLDMTPQDAFLCLFSLATGFLILCMLSLVMTARIYIKVYIRRSRDSTDKTEAVDAGPR